MMMVLHLHPNRADKIGPGLKGIRVNHIKKKLICFRILKNIKILTQFLLQVAKSKHGDSRCFEVVRIDGTFEDFSYHKCVLGATRIIAPKKVNFYKSKYLKNGTVQSGRLSGNPQTVK